MAITVWPTIKGTSPNPRVSFVEKNIVQESAGGQQFVVNLWATGKKRYTFTYNGISTTATVTAVGQDYNGHTELNAILESRAALKGSFGTINVVDPITNSNVLCRLESDELELTQEDGMPWWTGSVTFISIV